jgi:hypothetical protein
MSNTSLPSAGDSLSGNCELIELGVSLAAGNLVEEFFTNHIAGIP